jgi:hypothetical protein
MNWLLVNPSDVRPRPETPAGIVYQPSQKFTEAWTVELALNDHETNLSSGIDCRDQVEPVASSRALDHGRLSLRRPGLTSVLDFIPTGWYTSSIAISRDEEVICRQQ